MDIHDKTGIYNATRNPTGFFAPNYDIAQVTTGQLLITVPNATTLIPGTQTYTVDVFPTLPNVIGTEFELQAVDLTGDNKFIDGIYEFTLQYAGTWGPNLLQWRQRIAFSAQAACCLAALQIEVQQGHCKCDSIKYLDWVRGELALKAVCADMYCAKQNYTAEALLELRQICARNPCSNCN